jgi:outer membrane protein assembly factor BamB
MTTAETSRPPARRTFFRFWFPWVFLGVVALALAGIWLWPDDDYVLASRNFATLAIAQLAPVVLLIWGLIVSRRRYWILAGAVLIVAGFTAIVRNVELTGDMAPIFHFRWERRPVEELEAGRAPHNEVASASPADVATAEALDSPEFRGQKRAGVVAGPAIARDWKAHQPRLLWRRPIGGGYAGFVIAGANAVTIEQRRDQEAVVCYDSATGSERWAYTYPARFTETLGGEGPRATPTIAGDTVYFLGAQGHLACLDLATGKLRWSVDILKDNANVHWGMSGSPLVFDNLVVVNPGAQTPAAAGKALVAYDRETGKEVWAAGDTHAGYSSPMLADLAGKRQILLFDGEGLGGYDPEKGSELWRYEWKTPNEINVAQPVVLDGDGVFISSAYGMGGAMLRVAEAGGKWSVETRWKTKRMRCKFTSPVAYQGFIYGLDEGILACLDAANGQLKWRGGRYGHGQLLLTENLLLILGESGQLALVDAAPAAFHELARISALEGKTWNTPALAGGRAFVRNHQEMACYDLTRGNR